MKSNTVDTAEIEKFSQMAGEWWDPHGQFKPLHQMNPLRVQYIKDQVEKHFGSLADRALLDIGCGGGLVTEAMAKLGARTTGIDASGENIEVAKLHAEQSNLSIDYRCTTAEALGDMFDIVLALEIVEHVADVKAFITACVRLTKPGGLIIISTMNRTMKSFAMAIVGAEYIFRLLPRGTHEWEKFLKPHELINPLRGNGIEIKEMVGMVMHPLSWKWQLSAKDLDVNYLVTGTKPA
jgi:2-polyprenyl-6-hydroxyphenyl methylase / 3-demethylubiquinone-9 3-methyltransferase